MGADDTTKLDEGTDPKPEPTEDEGAGGGSEGEPKPAAEGQGGGDGEPSDKHGQPGINREKYQRDMKAKDDKIAELQAQLDEKSKTEEGRAELKDELDKLKAEMADERISHKLEMAGCRNVKAAKALLDDYEGDVAKLKEACPYLFSEKQTGSTGLKSDGDAAKASEEKVDKILSKYKR
ncbi:hypothetical protein [Thermophilibacter provencensis]|uniref:hypothetical protein n=1 Tax=Thermophilibacter provencensis TaxID=1852386 RepID=UPI003AA7C417